MIIQIKDKSQIHKSLIQDISDFFLGIKEFCIRERKAFIDDVINGYFYYLDENFVLLDYEENKLAGILLVEKDFPKNVYNINVLAVKKEYRGKHIATNLINKFIGRRKGLFIIETESVFTIPLALYKSLGFIEEARIKDFWKKGSDKIILTKRV